MSRVLQFPFRAAAENLAIVRRIDEQYVETAKELESTDLLRNAILMKHSENEHTRRRAEIYFEELQRRGITVYAGSQQ